MLTAVTAAFVLMGSATLDSEPQIVSASLFKNGYAVIVREIQLKGKETVVSNLPGGMLGTYWVTGSKGVHISGIIRSSVAPPKSDKAMTISAILAMNIGEEVALQLDTMKESYAPPISGRVVSADGSVVVLESNGKTSVIQEKRIIGLDSISHKLKLHPGKTFDRLTIRSDAPKGAKAYIVSLVNGVTWTPAFSADISNPAKLTIIAKATIMNDLGDLSNVSTRLVTGYPNIRYVEVADPMASAQEVSEFVSALNKATTPPEDRGRGNPSMNSYMPPPRSMEISSFIKGSSLSGQVEDMFFYPIKQVNLRRGDRGYYTLFSKECSYQHLYTWGYNSETGDTDSTSSDVWHCLKIRNETDVPWTTAPITTFKNGEMLGQDTIHYTLPGGDALVRITKALDIQVDSTTEEMSREPGALKDPSGNAAYDRVTYKTTFTVRNLKSEAVKLLAQQVIQGSQVDTSMKPTQGPVSIDLSSLNPNNRYEWLLDAKPGETISWTCTFKSYVKIDRSSRGGYGN